MDPAGEKPTVRFDPSVDDDVSPLFGELGQSVAHGSGSDLLGRVLLDRLDGDHV